MEFTAIRIRKIQISENKAILKRFFANRLNLPCQLMSNARKKDLERLIAHHAQLVIYGKRKYHIKSVINRKQKEELNDVELKVIRERPYVEFSKEERAKRKEENRKRYQEKRKKKKRKRKPP